MRNIIWTNNSSWLHFWHTYVFLYFKDCEEMPANAVYTVKVFINTKGVIASADDFENAVIVLSKDVTATGNVSRRVILHSPVKGRHCHR